MNTFIEPARTRGKAATRARVLAAARAALEQRGYEGTNLRDVAREAGVAVGTVLLHFEDKRDLLHAAFHDSLAQAAAEALAAARGRASLEARLATLAGGLFASYERRRDLSRALLRESLFADEPWASRFAAQVGALSADLAGFVDEAKARGELRPDADGAVLVAAFFSFYYFALLAWLQGGHPEPRRLFGALLAQHLGPLAPATPARGTTRARRPR